jgi:hypothetical protein
VDIGTTVDEDLKGRSLPHLRKNILRCFAARVLLFNVPPVSEEDSKGLGLPATR